MQERLISPPFQDLVPPALRQAWRDDGSYAQRPIFSLFAEHARRQPGHDAVICGLERISYAALHDAALRLAHGLQQLGVTQGTIVACQLPNQWQACALELALAALGAVIAALPPGRGWLDLAALLKRSRARVFICADPALQQRLAAQAGLPHLRQFVLLDAAAHDAAGAAPLPSLTQLLQSPPLAVLPAVDPDTALRLLVSSGTEAEPKLVAYSHNALAGGRGRFLQRLLGAAGVQSAGQDDDPLESIQHAHHIWQQSGQTPYAGQARNMRGLFLLPLGSSFGSLASFGLLACLGGTLLLLPHFDAEQALQVMAQQQVTHVFGVPTMLQRMASAVTANAAVAGENGITVDGTPFPHLAALVSGGAQLDPASLLRCRQAFSCAVLSLYGSADGVNCHTMPGDSLEHMLHSVGRPFAPVCEIRIVDEARQNLPAGQIGEIAARGPMTPMQYVHAPELDRRYRDTEGWVYTGDLGMFDQAGYLHLAGRKKDIIIRGGCNISPSQIENLISAHSEVISAACVPVPDADLGQKVALCLVLRPARPTTAGVMEGSAATAATAMLAPAATLLHLPQVNDFLLARGLERNKLPQFLRCYAQFPLTPAGKVDKRMLAADFLPQMACA